MKALVILYDSQISNSVTLTSLSRFASELVSLGLKEIVIWNNGSQTLKFSSHCYQVLAALNRSGISINIQECLANAPLSHIYNRYIQNQDYGVIFDDDTNLTSSYIEGLRAFINSSAQIFLPLIYANNAVFYPYLNGQLVTPNQEPLFTGEVASIASGMCISPEAINLLKTKYAEAFDSRFNIYGVDTTFFLRASKSNIRSYLIDGRLNHNLSRATEDHSKISQFRYKERLCDIVLQIRRYLSWKTIKYLNIFIKRYTLKKFVAHLPLAITVFITGRHPRTHQQYSSQAIALDLDKLDQVQEQQTI